MAKTKTNDAFSSGMRGKEKGGGTKQHAGGTVGNPKGEKPTAHSSGMRGSEKPKQAPDSANLTTSDTSRAGGENARIPNTHIGDPGAENSANVQKVAPAMNDGTLQQHTSDAYGMDGNSLERAALGMQPDVQEDDTHLNIRIPKASIKRSGK
jgi:hypothetical protein